MLHVTIDLSFDSAHRAGSNRLSDGVGPLALMVRRNGKKRVMGLVLRRRRGRGSSDQEGSGACVS